MMDGFEVSGTFFASFIAFAVFKLACHAGGT